MAHTTNILPTTLRKVSCALISILVLLTLIPDTGELNFQHLFFAVAAIGIGVISFLLSFHKKPYIDLIDGLFVALSLGLLGHYFLVGGRIAPVRILQGVLLAVVYFGIRSMYKNYPGLKNLVLSLLFVVCSLEAILGMMQLLGILPVEFEYIHIAGTFINSGPYAGYLAMAGSMAWIVAIGKYPYVQKIAKSRSYPKVAYRRFYTLASVCALFTLLVLPFTESRSAWIAFLLPLTVWLLRSRSFRRCIKRYRRAQYVVGLGTGLIVLLLAAGFLMYRMKQPSADGRLLIWKTSARSIAEHPAVGIGVGGFAGTYEKYQTPYLNSDASTPSEKMVAGLPTYAFNDYIEMAVETGLFFSLFTLLFIGLIIRRQMRGSSIFAYALLSWLGFACFSYPSAILSMQIGLIMCLAIRPDAKTSLRLPGRLFRMVLLGITLLLSLGVSFRYIKLVNSTLRWQSLRYCDEVYRLRVMDLLYRDLNHNARFLFDYGCGLQRNLQSDKSIVVLEKGNVLAPQPMFYIAIGDSYKNLFDYSRAEDAYIKAYEMLPCRIFPLYRLMFLYDETCQYEKALATANRIIDTPIKITTTISDDIRQEATEYMKYGKMKFKRE